jgi:signal transduction histidine kinase
MRYLDYRLKKQGITFEQNIDSNLVIPTAPHDLEELLLNIMINAIQAMETGGKLSITAHRSDAQIEIHIEDTGIGIPEDKIKDVFDLFYSTKKAGEGTGLGMWMTYELVKKYKGDIAISSQLGVGTRVSIILPEGVR